MDINLYELPEGWIKSFGSNLVIDIVNFYVSIPRERQKYFIILQIKEKYGELRIYHTCHLEDIDNFDWIIKKYEEIAKQTCIHCGRAIEKGQALCDDCKRSQLI